MIEITDVLIKGEIFSQRYNTQRIPLAVGEYCLAESSIGIQIGKIVSTPRVMKKRFLEETLPNVIRKTSEADWEHLSKLEELEKTGYTFCLERITARALSMKLVKVIFAFDRSKALFMFTADGRVDFRELVRDLAHHFKTRIEMKQIGIRDEARILGGIGICGCSLCCVCFLREFHPVSIKMAKDQGLSLIPTKISGVCGRLMCCLQYEHDHYSEEIKKMPRIGKRVMTPKGEGRVRQLNVLRNRALVEIEEGDLREFDVSELTKSTKEDDPMSDSVESAESVGPAETEE